MTKKEMNKLLDEVMSNCENCSRRLNCPEKECPFYRIEQLVIKFGEKDL